MELPRHRPGRLRPAWSPPAVGRCLPGLDFLSGTGPKHKAMVRDFKRAAIYQAPLSGRITTEQRVVKGSYCVFVLGVGVSELFVKVLLRILITVYLMDGFQGFR